MKRVALYARVSTDKQDLTGQQKRLREWAARMDYEVHIEETDVRSGRDGNRPGMDRVYKAAIGRHVHAVAVCKLDRWGRSVINLTTTINRMVDTGVSFHAIDQGITLDKKDPMGQLQLNIMSAFAQFERDMISERTKEGLRALAPGKGAGRHPATCGISRPCPTGKHINPLEVTQ